MHMRKARYSVLGIGLGHLDERNKDYPIGSIFKLVFGFGILSVSVSPSFVSSVQVPQLQEKQQSGSRFGSGGGFSLLIQKNIYKNVGFCFGSAVLVYSLHSLQAKTDLCRYTVSKRRRTRGCFFEWEDYLL